MACDRHVLSRIDRRCLLALAVGGAWTATAHAEGSLTRRATALIEEKIAAAFPDIAEITPAELAHRLTMDRGRFVLLDVRTKEEAAISRIADAVPVDPDTRSTSPILAACGSLEGKTVVAYCSIGLRSARLLARIGGSLSDRGAVAQLNLRGGMFRWRNEGRPLVSATGLPTRAIHPYNILWRQFLADNPAG